MLTIGLTGNLASGKTTVAAMFKDLGAKILDADSIGHQCLKRGHPCYHRIVKAFGPDILKGPDIDRKKLGELVFSDGTLLKQLNRIIHPEVIRTVRRNLKQHQGKQQPLVVEAALLMESGLHRCVDLIVLVVSRRDLQLKRAASRLNITKAQAAKRMAQQWPISEKLKVADIVIDNRGSLPQTKKQVEGIWQRLRQRKHKK